MTIRVEYQDLLRSFKDNCGFGLIANIKNRPSHANLENAITALERMMHRGAVAADGKTGDGSGLLLSLPHEFMRARADEAGVELPEMYAVAVVFTRDASTLQRFEQICAANDLKVVLDRRVPVDTNALGEQALSTLPEIHHIFITANSLMASQRFDALLYLSR